MKDADSEKFIILLVVLLTISGVSLGGIIGNEIGKEKGKAATYERIYDRLDREIDTICFLPTEIVAQRPDKCDVAMSFRKKIQNIQDLEGLD